VTLATTSNPDAPAKVLIVEDDVHLRTVVRMVLERDGHEVIEARNGRDGLSVMAATSVSVVIADMRMPITSGAEMVAIIRSDAAMAHTPILLMSGYADRPKCQADAWLQKPFEAADLSAAVRALIAKSSPHTRTAIEG
jgi:DNA-binding response OmpR family regulator